MGQSILIFVVMILLWAVVTGCLLVSVWAIVWRAKSYDPARIAISAVVATVLLVSAIAVGFAATDIVAGFGELQEWQRTFGNGNIPFLDSVPLAGFQSPAQFRSLVGQNLAQTLIGSAAILVSTALLLRSTRSRAK